MIKIQRQLSSRIFRKSTLKPLPTIINFSSKQQQFYSISLFLSNEKNNNNIQLLETFFKNPNGSDALSLISKQNISLENSFKVYECIIKDNKTSKIYLISIILALITECNKNKQFNKTNLLWDDISNLLNKTSDNDLKRINSFTWNRMISGLCYQKKHLDQVLYLYNVVLQKNKIIPDEMTLQNILNLCSETDNTSKVIEIFNDIKNKYNLKPNIKHYGCLIKAYSKIGNFKEIIKILNHLDNLNDVIFTISLNGGILKKDLNFVKEIHLKIEKDKIKKSPILWKTLIEAYSACGDIETSISLFREMEKEYPLNIVVCNTLIAALGQYKKGKEAIYLFYEMIEKGVKLDEIIFGTLLNTLAESNMPKEAKELFYSIQPKYKLHLNIVHYNCLIKALIKSKPLEELLYLFDEMKEKRIQPDFITYDMFLSECKELNTLNFLYEHIKLNNIKIKENSSILKVYNTMINIYGKYKKGKEALNLFNELTVEKGIKPDDLIFKSLLDSLAESQMLEEANRIFNLMTIDFNITPNVFHYNSLIKLYIYLQRNNDALEVLQRMTNCKIQPNETTLRLLVNNCNNDISILKSLHSLINNLEFNISLQTSLIKAYTKCGNLKESISIFNELIKQQNNATNVIVWSNMMNAYGIAGKVNEALKIFIQMQEMDIQLNEIVFITILNILAESNLVNEALDIFNLMKFKYKIKPLAAHYNCLIKLFSKNENFDKAFEILNKMKDEGVTPDNNTYSILLNDCKNHSILKEILNSIEQSNIEKNSILVTNLISAYARCNDLETATFLFKQMKSKNIMTYNIMINIYISCGKTSEALELFSQMENNVKPNAITFVYLLNIYAEIGDLENTKKLFKSMEIQYGIKPDVTHYGCLSKCYVKSDQLQNGLNLLQEMESKNIKPNENIYTILLSGCANRAVLSIGKQLHKHLEENNIQKTIPLLTTLIDMYSKCGDLESSVKVFKEMKDLNIVTYNTMINAYGTHGKAR
ncbi:hypothetical protein ABK040_015477 [Willaertia magna]